MKFTDIANKLNAQLANFFLKLFYNKKFKKTHKFIYVSLCRNLLVLF